MSDVTSSIVRDPGARVVGLTWCLRPTAIEVGRRAGYRDRRRRPVRRRPAYCAGSSLFAVWTEAAYSPCVGVRDLAMGVSGLLGCPPGSRARLVLPDDGRAPRGGLGRGLRRAVRLRDVRRPAPA